MQKRPKRARILSAFTKSDDGASAVEFAILSIPFFMIVFAIIETFIALIAEQIITNATDNMARRVYTGQISETYPQEQFRLDLCKEISILIRCSSNEYKNPKQLYVDLRKFNKFSEMPTTLPLIKHGEYYDLDTSTFGYAVGGKGTINMLRVYYRWPVIVDMLRPYLTNIRPVDGSMKSHSLLIATEAFKIEGG